jgi:hypothetical protein
MVDLVELHLVVQKLYLYYDFSDASLFLLLLRRLGQSLLGGVAFMQRAACGLISRL